MDHCVAFAWLFAGGKAIPVGTIIIRAQAQSCTVYVNETALQLLYVPNAQDTAVFVGLKAHHHLHPS